MKDQHFQNMKRLFENEKIEKEYEWFDYTNENLFDEIQNIEISQNAHGNIDEIDDSYYSNGIHLNLRILLYTKLLDPTILVNVKLLVKLVKHQENMVIGLLWKV